MHNDQVAETEVGRQEHHGCSDVHVVDKEAHRRPAAFLWRLHAAWTPARLTIWHSGTCAKVLANSREGQVIFASGIQW